MQYDRRAEQHAVAVCIANMTPIRRDRTIFLFTDFGTGDIYVGQVKSVLGRCAPEAPVVDLLHEAPRFDPKSGAHLLAALVQQLPAESVIFAVVDPGVGGARNPVTVRADGRWYVGPDNGLLSVITARTDAAQIFPILWQPQRLSASFHGRDLFAVTAAGIARGEPPNAEQGPQPHLDVQFGPGDLPAIIYVDHYGNAITGLRAAGISRRAVLHVDHHKIENARVFSEVQPGEVFWYENSLGLVEIAVNCGSAAEALDLHIGQLLTINAR